MLIEVKARNEDDSISFEGTLNKKEVGFLLMYAINDLMSAGVEFNLNMPNYTDESEEEEAMRIKFPHERLN